MPQYLLDCQQWREATRERRHEDVLGGEAEKIGWLWELRCSGCESSSGNNIGDDSGDYSGDNSGNDCGNSSGLCSGDDSGDSSISCLFVRCGCGLWRASSLGHSYWPRWKSLFYWSVSFAGAKIILSAKWIFLIFLCIEKDSINATKLAKLPLLHMFSLELHLAR